MPTFSIATADVLPALTFLGKATVILCGALAASALLRRASAGVRHLVWLATLVVVLLLPALSRWVPLKLEILPTQLATVAQNDVAPIAADEKTAAVERAAPSRIANQHIDRSVTSEAKRAGDAPSESAAADLTQQPYGGWVTLLVVWAVVTLALLTWVIAGAISVARIVAGARPLLGHEWEVALCEVADRLDLEATPRLLASERVEMPFACGVLRPTIVLPATADRWTDERRRAVLFHELAHVRRRDLVGHTLGRLACALYWFHPLVWTAAKRLRAESERACDDLVLACGARASDYADHLLEMVTSVRRHAAPAMALPMARRREFEGRMLAILDPQVKRVGPGRLQSAALILTLGALSLSVAAMAPVPRQPVEMQRENPPAEPMATVTAPATPLPSMHAAPNASQNQDVRAGVPLRVAESLSNPSPSPSPVLQVEVDTPPVQRMAQSTDSKDTTLSNPERVTLLQRLLRTDPDASVRRAAAWGLEPAVSDEGAVRALAEALGSDKTGEVREMAAWALAGSTRPAALRALNEALRRDTDSEVRETAVWALGQSEGRADPAVLEAALRDESSEVRSTAAWALGQSEQTRAPSALLAALGDSDPEVRLTVAWALGQIQDQESRPALLSAFQTETNAEVRRAELRALAFMGERSRALLDKALASTDPELRRHAVRMLAGQGVGPWPWPWPRPQPRPSP